MNGVFIRVKVVENNAFVQIELGLEEEDIENEDELDDASQIRPTLKALISPNMWIGYTAQQQRWRNSQRDSDQNRARIKDVLAITRGH